tara:strand:+ start:237 stop:1154 length:918 start_codon:yes stop_codon:yes gene_type:complete
MTKILKKYLIVILGPTASGKTSLAIKVAKKLKCEIISADSRQFFKEMNIGTAKPNEKELSKIKHHFINNLSVKDDYNAGNFENDALKTLDNLYKKFNYVIMTGGSGLYIDAVCYGLDFFPKIPIEFREKLINEFKRKGLKNLLNELKIKDIKYYRKVDKNNFHRIIRALEVIRFSGKRFSDFTKNSKKKRNFQIIKIGIEHKKEKLHEFIDRRVDLMVHNGLFDEVKDLIKYKNKNALNTLGYKEVFQYFKNKNSKKEIINQIKINTKKYAKRQNTWFNRNNDVKWFKLNFEKIINYINKQINNY